MCGFGTGELLIVLAIVLLVFGASRLPQLGKALGETVKNFKNSSGEQNKSNETKGQQVFNTAEEKKQLADKSDENGGSKEG